MRLFWNEQEHRLRALWRLALHAILTFVLGALPILLVAEPLTALHKRGLFLASHDKQSYDRIINMIVGPLLAVAIAAAVFLAARWLDRRSVRDFGLIVDRAWWRNLAFGFAIGGAVMAFVFATEWALGWIEITSVMHGAPIAFAYTIVKVLCVATYEELVARGYQLRNLAEGTNMATAVILSSSVFALLHLTNENASLMSTLGLFINGVLFALAVLATGRLSTSIGLHMAWNLFQGLVFGFPVSGDKEGASVVGIRQLGPELFTGGAFGPEAGGLGVAASVLGMAILWTAWRRNASRPRLAECC